MDSPKSGSNVNTKLNICLEGNYSYFELNLDPLRYFYPWLFTSEDSFYDPEDGISEEDFEILKKSSIERINMFRSKNYKDLFKIKIEENLESFLRQMEYEVEIEYEEYLSKDQSIPKLRLQLERSLLDLQFKKNEDYIFEFLKKKGLLFLRNKTIVSKIQEWCIKKNNKKIKKLSETIKDIAKIKPGPPPTSLPKTLIIEWDPMIRSVINEVKNKIKSYEKEIRKDSAIGEKLFQEINISRFEWGDLLFQVACEEQGDSPGDFVKFIRSTQARDISIKVLVKAFGVSERMADEILRNKKDIMNHKKTLEQRARNFEDIKIWTV